MVLGMKVGETPREQENREKEEVARNAFLAFLYNQKTANKAKLEETHLAAAESETEELPDET